MSAACRAERVAVSAQDRAGFPRELWTEREGGIPPELTFLRDEREQACVVCERVMASREGGRDGTARTPTLLDGHRVVIGYAEPHRLSQPGHGAVDEREVTYRELSCIEGWGVLLEASLDSVKEGR